MGCLRGFGDQPSSRVELAKYSRKPDTEEASTHLNASEVECCAKVRSHRLTGLPVPCGPSMLRCQSTTEPVRNYDLMFNENKVFQPELSLNRKTWLFPLHTLTYRCAKLGTLENTDSFIHIFNTGSVQWRLPTCTGLLLVYY